MSDLIGCRFWILLEQGNGSDDDAGGAESALHATLVDDGLLNRMQTLFCCEAFDGRDFAAIGLRGENQARGDGFAVEYDGACPAIAGAAALFGARHVELVAKGGQQGLAGFYGDLMCDAVDGDFNVVGHAALLALVPVAAFEAA